MICNNTKRFKQNSVFDLSLNPVPKTIRLSLDYIFQRFPVNFIQDVRVLHETGQNKMYGLMTSYVGRNFCWMQPTGSRSISVDFYYDQYLRKINQRSWPKITPPELKPGMDCIVRYQEDNHWYRGIILRELPDYKWLVLFVDYGNYQICDSTQIAEPIVDSAYNHYEAPTQAICCRLYNIVPTLPSYREDVDLYLERFFEARNRVLLEIKVRSLRKDNIIDCDIFLPRSKKEGEDRLYRRHIGQELVDAGLATFADPVAARSVKDSSPSLYKNNFNLLSNQIRPDTFSFESLVL